MEIIQIVRKVTGSNYSNIELTAAINENDDAVSCAIELDKKCEEMLNKISEGKQIELENNHKKRVMLDKIESLKMLVEENKVDDLPF